MNIRMTIYILGILLIFEGGFMAVPTATAAVYHEPELLLFAILAAALLLTGIVTATMTLLGLVAPNVFLGMGRTLFIALIVGILAELVATFLFHYTGTAFDWLFVVLFSGYIGYDVAKSQIYPKTVDNAVDCALDIYLDIINIFIRLLALLSRKE
jgi:FtsH-binding integral membrane protein